MPRIAGLGSNGCYRLQNLTDELLTQLTFNGECESADAKSSRLSARCLHRRQSATLLTQNTAHSNAYIAEIFLITDRGLAPTGLFTRPLPRSPTKKISALCEASHKADKRALSIGRVSELTSRSSDHCVAQASGRKWPTAARCGRL
jgi:hypothetical protein